MPDLKEQYKAPRSGFGDTDHSRYLRTCNYNKSRKEARTRTFNRNRNLRNDLTPTSPQRGKIKIKVTSTITDERMKKLIKWKEERNRKKNLEAAMKKPVFKVGIVHHPLCSSMIKSGVTTAETSNKPTENSNNLKKRITRATEKRLLARAAQQTVKDPTSVSGIKNSFKTLTSYTKKSFASANYCFKSPSGLQKMSLFDLVPMKETTQGKYPLLHIQTSDITEIFKPTHPKLSLNKQKSRKLSDSIIRDSDELNVIETTGMSLKEQARKQTNAQDFLHEENFLLNSTNIKTPPKNSPTLFEKENCNMEDLISFSPYLTRSRGKRNSRKEGQQRLGISRPSDEIPTKETVMKNLNICVEEEKRTAQYFKLLVNKETNRLTELCKKWLNIRITKDVPEDAMYEIQQAVGQTNLLINKKFERFRGLVQDCETGRGEMLVTCRDLQGFWDMTYMEVKDCDMRFEKLEQRQNREWQEEEYTTVIKPTVKKRMPIKKQTVSSKPSSLRSLILAARKNKMKAGTLSKKIILPQDTRENTNTRHSIRSKSYDLNERKSTLVQRESSKINLVQKVQYSDKTKRMKSPFATIKISQMCKTPEIQLDDTISYINSDQTPGKSILKKSEELENKEARIKSAHKVNFDDQVILNEVPLYKEMQTKLNLAAALNRIDIFDDLDKINPLISSPINAEKRLDFEIEDSDSREGKIAITAEIISKNMEDLNLEMKVLRNRTILANNTPRSSRTSKMKLIKKNFFWMTPKKTNNKDENESPVKLRKKSSLKLLPRNENEHMTSNKNDTIQIENVILTDNTTKRRSLRNVAFDETCVACTENKTMLPMTPYSKRRSKTPSRQNRNKSIDIFSEDLISWNTPDKKYCKF
ncbi:Disks large-associated protein 5 [Cyphomyrmex costatus]|uniref:Disks large-associated protein 5 n=1 Tax=Cyphomyrmex costatus TaxID=456900 RepID=A0A195C0G3_9HYME|nr:Disks large-associated protein 5 [Cyphomyrmex costatus]